jgi:D-alanine transfer protein
MKSVHLWAATVAVGIIGVVLVIGTLAAVYLEDQYVHGLVGSSLRKTIMGTGLQRAAFRQADLLPVYGSSEIEWGSPYDARAIFGRYATGFNIFDVANGYSHSLTNAQRLAAIGPDLKGKKVVISVTPWAFTLKTVPADAYASLFSRLHANETIFSRQLSTATKRAAARRMLEYPDTLHDDPILRLAVHNLAGDSSLFQQAQYWAIWPLGKLQTLIIELQDHWETASVILMNRRVLKSSVPHVSSTIDWQAWLDKARQEQILDANNNPYGIQNDEWTEIFRDRVQNKEMKTTDKQYLKELSSSAEWTDLDILLRVLKDMGARPLLMSRPIHGPFWGAMGVSKAARKVFYDRLHKVAASYGVPVVDFADYEGDKYFSTDPAEHTSRVGWIYVDQALDAFYHENP